jgi:hypothetical protein
MAKQDIETDWSEVAAKAQAYQALHLAGKNEATVAEKAKFLKILGLSRPDIAGLIDSTEESVRKSLERADAAGKTPKVAKDRRTDGE